MSISENILIFWLVVLNAVALCILAWAQLKLPRSKAKASFLIFLFGYCLWMNPLLLVQLFGRVDKVGYFFAQAILAGGAIFVAALGSFMLTLAAPEELQRLRFKLFILHFIILFFLAFTPLFQTGITVTEEGLVPIKGPLQPYFDLTMVTFGIYFIVVCIRSYLKSNVPLLRCQLETLLLCGVPAFTIGLLTNAVIPGITGNFQLTPTGGVWLLLLFGGIGFILANGPFLLLRHKIWEFAEVDGPADEASLLQLTQLFRGINRWSADGQQPVHKRITFKHRSGAVRELLLTSDKKKEKVDNAFNAVSEDYLEGNEWLPVDISSNSSSSDKEILKRLGKIWVLDNDNSNLAVGLNKLSPVTRTILAPAPPKSEPIKASAKNRKLSELYNLLEIACAPVQSKWGIELIAVSERMNEVVARIAIHAQDRRPVLFVGETGSGKRTVAQLLYHMRGQVGSLPSNKTFIENREGKRNDECENHLLIPNCEESELLKMMHGSEGLALYATAERSLNLDLLGSQSLEQITLPPLRERKEDLFYAIIKAIRDNSQLLNVTPGAVETESLEMLMERSLRGNFIELSYLIRAWISSHFPREELLCTRQLADVLANEPDEIQLAKEIYKSVRML